MRFLLLVAAVLASLTFSVGSAQADDVPVAEDQQQAEGQVLIQYRSDISPLRRILTNLEVGGVQVGSLPSGVAVVAIFDGDAPDETADEAEAQSEVVYAEPNYVYHADALPNDPLIGDGKSHGRGDAWGLNNSGQDGGLVDADIDAPEGWQAAGFGGNGVWNSAGGTAAVGVIDTGIDATHPEFSGSQIRQCVTSAGLKGKLAEGCTDENGHGTHVAGIAGAQGNNGAGIAGVALGFPLVICRALDAQGAGFASDVATCLYDLIKQRDKTGLVAVNLSLGGPPSQVLQAAVESAAAAGIVVTASAGNSGGTQTLYPAGYESTVSVAATDRRDQHASFSTANASVDIAAPGVSIVSTVPVAASSGGDLPAGYAMQSGTSMAAPFVVGALALVAERTGLRGGALRDRVVQSTDDLGAAGRDDLFGNGRLNLCHALGGDCVQSAATGEAPTADFTVEGGQGVVGVPLELDAGASFDTDGEVVSYSWDFNGDGKADANGAVARTKYSTAGTKNVELTVTDDSGSAATLRKRVNVLGGKAAARALLAKARVSVVGGSVQKIGTVLNRGLRVKCTAPARVRCSAKASASRSTGATINANRKLAAGLTGRGGPSGTTFRMRFTTPAREQLSQASGARLRVTVEVKVSGLKRKLGKTVQLKR